MALRSVTPKSQSRAVVPSFSGVERSQMLQAAEREYDLSEEDALLLVEAYQRFNYCFDWESRFRDLYVQDVKFANADPDNGWQWPDDLRRDRMLARRPALTINKVQNHVNLVVNDSRQNKAGIEVKPAGQESSFKAAQGLEALIRNIEYQSTATSIYDEMSQSQVEGGIGYGRVISMYPDPMSFKQELRISPVENHMNVFLDPDIKLKNGLDAKYGFIFSDIAKEAYEEEYDEDAPTGTAPLGMGLGADWIKADHVRVAEYFRINSKKEELIYYRHGDQEATFLRSDVPRGLRASLREHEAAMEKGTLGDDVEIITRETEIKTLQWYKIGAHKILDRKEYRTQYVPIFRFVGRERVIDGKLERKGLVRPLKDAQRMYNYNSSAEAEAAAIATKTNWLVALEAISGNENAWNKANVENKAVLTYRHKDRDGDPIPPPQRVDPAKSAEAYLSGMEIAAREFEMASGQGPAQFGRLTKERTGRAINETQRQGEIITYDFLDHQALGIQAAGIILLDWIPYCYDTKQVIQILDKDGTERLLTIDPNAENAYDEQKTADQVQAVLNPKIGRYKVQAQPGPAYATQRQEAWNAFVQIITGAPELVNEIGDLMFLSADFPMASEIAERMRRKIKQTAPWLLDENAAGPLVQQLQGQLQQAGQQLAELLQQLAEKDRKLRDQSADIEINRAKALDGFRKTNIQRYDAHTKRITAVTNAQLDLDRTGDDNELETLIRSMIEDVLSGKGKEDGATPALAATEPDRSANDDGADFLEPRQAPDGNHYVRHGGQHFMVDPSAFMNGGGGGQPA